MFDDQQIKFALKIKQAHGCGDDDDWWGGLNVVMCGDFHQFPPVAVGCSENLFTVTENEEASHPKAIGWKIYEEFTVVVILEQQKRVYDEEWLQFLRHLRMGCVTWKDISMLQSLILSLSSDNGIDHSTPCSPYELERTSMSRNVFIFWSEIVYMLSQGLYWRSSTQLGGTDECKKSLAVKKTKCLPDEIEIAIGMKVLVTYNVETNLDTSTIRLRYLPKFILVRMECTKVCKLLTLEENMIPIEPMTMRLNIQS